MAIKAITTSVLSLEETRGKFDTNTQVRFGTDQYIHVGGARERSRSKCVSSRRSLEILMSVCCTPSLRLRDGPTTHASTSSVLLHRGEKKPKSYTNTREHEGRVGPGVSTGRRCLGALSFCALRPRQRRPRTGAIRDMSPAQRLAVAHERHPESHPAADAALLATLQERIDKAKTKAAAPTQS